MYVLVTFPVGKLTLGIVASIALDEFHGTFERGHRAIARGGRSPAFCRNETDLLNLEITLLGLAGLDPSKREACGQTFTYTYLFYSYTMVYSYLS